MYIKLKDNLAACFTGISRVDGDGFKYGRFFQDTFEPVYGIEAVSAAGNGYLAMVEQKA